LLPLLAGDVISFDVVISCKAVVSSCVAVVIGSLDDEPSSEVTTLIPYVEPLVVIIESIDDDRDISDGVIVIVANSNDEVRLGADDVIVEDAVVCWTVVVWTVVVESCDVVVTVDGSSKHRIVLTVYTVRLKCELVSRQTADFFCGGFINSFARGKDADLDFIL
jgi:hypothetical protein